MDLLTASRLKAARACKRLHHYRYDLGYRPIYDAEDLRFGTLFHKAEEAWWNAIKAGLPQDAWLDEALAAIDSAADADPFARAKARAMMTGYHYRWKDERYEVLGVEETFEMQLVNPETGAASRTWQLGGKLDVRVRDLNDGQVKVVEHKTSAVDITPGSDYWKRLRLDGQVSIYFDGASSFGEPVAACVYDVIGKPALRPSQIPVLDDDGVKIVVDAQGERVRTKDGKKWRQTADTAEGFILQTRPETADEYEARLVDAIAENPSKYYGRAEVVRLEDEIQEARYDVWQTAKEIREGQVAQRYPRNDDSCVRYGKTCEFFGVCTREASLEDPALFRRLEHVHPELQAEAAGA